MDGQEWQDRALARYRDGAYVEALEAFARAQAAYEQAGDPTSAAEMLNNQGVTHRMRGEWSKAEAAFMEARERFVQLGDGNRGAQATTNLGMVASAQGQAKRAEAYLKEAIAAFQEQGDRVRESDAWRVLSMVYFKQWRWLNALAVYSSALDCAPRLSLGQRFLRWLFRLPLRLLGGR